MEPYIPVFNGLFSLLPFVAKIAVKEIFRVSKYQ